MRLLKGWPKDMRIFYHENQHEDDWHNEQAGCDDCLAECGDGSKGSEFILGELACGA